MSKEYKELIVGLDIGTAKVTCMVAEVRPDGRLNIVGLGTQATNGLKRGVVVNIEATVDAISRVVQEVESMAECKIHEVYTGLAGSHIKSFNSSGTVAIKEKEVTPLDVERVIEVARAMPIPAEQQILHILTQEFIIDGQGGVREPIGMSGVRLVGLALSAREAWQLRLDNGLVIMLGRAQERSQLGDRLQRFITAWPRVREQIDIDIKVADLRYPNGFALTPADGTVLLQSAPQGASKGKQ